MSSTCIFCAISAGEAKADVVYEDDRVVAFRDISPQAPVHLVVVPRQHHESLDALPDKHGPLLNHLLITSRDLGSKHSPDHGYRITVNGGGQQEVPHLHFHVLGGLPELNDAEQGVSDQ